MKIYSEAVKEPPAVAPAFEYKTNILKECNQFQMRSMKETGKCECTSTSPVSQKF